jgi:hypothetical protein
MRRTWRGVSSATGPATSVTSAPASAAGAGDREAHLAARAVGQPAHRIDGLEGRPGGDEHPAAGEPLRLEERDHVGKQFGRLEHPPVADFAAGLVAAARAEHGRAVAAQLADVALRRRMRPHLAVHRRRDQQRAALDRPGQAEQREQVVGAAVQQLGQEVGAGRRDEHRVGFAREVDVRHAVRLAPVPLAAVDVAVRQRLQRRRGDEVLGGLGHHDLHRRTGLDQLAHQLGRLVAGDAAGQSRATRWRAGAARRWSGRRCPTAMGAAGFSSCRAADQRVEQRVRLGAGPVEVAEDHRVAARRGRSAPCSERRAASSEGRVAVGSRRIGSLNGSALEESGGSPPALPCSSR